jgi:hypothetical protein
MTRPTPDRIGSPITLRGFPRSAITGSEDVLGGPCWDLGASGLVRFAGLKPITSPDPSPEPCPEGSPDAFSCAQVDVAVVGARYVGLSSSPPAGRASSAKERASRS